MVWYGAAGVAALLLTRAAKRRHSEAMRFFNTAGPMRPQKHYCVPPLSRLDVDDLLTLIRNERYFVLHAPRQTGKTSALLALRDLLNGGAHGAYRCVYVNVEPGQAAREDVALAMRAILSELELEAEATLDDLLPARVWPDLLERAGATGVLRQVLTRWSLADPAPLVLLIDEIDTLIGDTLIAVLRQLRAGYAHRPRRFPQSVILCGVRDVRDYRIHSSAEKTVVTGGSAFNVKAKSLRIGDFTEAEVRALLGQHTAETGQPFAEQALRAVWELTAGQPWLVNALAQGTCFDDEEGRDRSRTITAEAIHDAREQLILRRETHVEQLTDKLQEERVQRVIGPVLSGSAAAETIRPDDLQYVRDLGLIARDAPVRVANPIYREVIPARPHLDYPGVPAARSGLVRGRRRQPEPGPAADGVPEVLPRALRALDRALPVPGGRAAVAAAGVPASHRQLGRPGGARVRVGANAHRPADHLAGRRAAGADAADGDRVQAAARQPGGDDPHRAGADACLHGPVRRRRGAPGDLRPHRGQAVARQAVPPRADRRRHAGHGVGDVEPPQKTLAGLPLATSWWTVSPVMTQPRASAASNGPGATPAVARRDASPTLLPDGIV